ncbi:MAG: hypothetical protein DMF80_04395 [Acidobacteria bacterium]|nr:MAG: hypothetical protein DMF80_04395 [Acidobacteriota bacterium]PYQ19880.1 MAG: hypothetical protein DMF81_20445 [Acidobacteriota bacterium]
MRAPAAARRWLASALVLLACLTVLPVLFERQLIYYPYRRLEVTPKELGLRFDDVRLVAEDGVVLHGWFLPVDGSRLTVLVCHGNAGNISHRLDRALLIHAKLRADVFLFDYRGYGRSEGTPDEAGTYRDGRAAYLHLTGERGIAPGRLVLFGESLGGAVALQLALEQPSRALVLESPFTSIADMAAVALPLLPMRYFVRTRYDNLAKIAALKVPLLVLHGEADTTVPLEQGRRVFEAAPEPKRFFAIPGAGHNDTYLTGGEAYWQAWSEFLAESGRAAAPRE